MWQLCNACGKRFKVLEDENNMHNCPKCGFGYEDDMPERRKTLKLITKDKKLKKGV